MSLEKHFVSFVWRMTNFLPIRSAHYEVIVHKPPTQRTPCRQGPHVLSENLWQCREGPHIVPEKSVIFLTDVQRAFKFCPEILNLSAGAQPTRQQNALSMVSPTMDSGSEPPWRGHHLPGSTLFFLPVFLLESELGPQAQSNSVWTSLSASLQRGSHPSGPSLIVHA